jgi:predicted ATPase/class 3 adenylate cyclase
VGAPDVTESTPSYPSGTVTFLFTDIGGSTRLWEQAPDAMRMALASHDAILRACVEARGGVVFKTVGDAVYAAFADPAAAVAASVDAQRKLDAHAWPEAVGRIEVRMAIHTGVVAETGGDYFGPPLNRVSRIMSLAFPGQILVSRASASLIGGALDDGIALRELGVFRLKDLSEPEPTAQVVAEGLRADFPPLPSLDARPNNLPYEIASFIGRETELAEISAQLELRRLLSIVGPGGIGKTRLALQAAANVVDRYPDGTWYVELASVSDGSLLAQSISIALGAQEEAQRSADDTLIDAIGSKSMLVILDGVDRIVRDTALLAKKLLSRCPSLQLFVTSREPLGVTGERAIRIGALAEAADLFIERAREIEPEAVSRIDTDGRSAIEQLCRRLDGIPLAIELAAAHAATLSPAELLERLSKSMKLLVSRDPTRDERHRTLRATIGWSVDLLGPELASALRALSVFDGTFSSEAAAALLDNDADDALEHIEDLAAKSILWPVGGSKPVRYVLPTTMREYERSLPEDQAISHERSVRHFRYYEGLVGAPLAGGTVPDAMLLERLDAEIIDVRSSLAWALQHLPVDAARMATAVAPYWASRGFLNEGRAVFRRALESEKLDAGLRARVLRRAASFAIERDDYDEARALNLECRALYLSVGDANGIAETSFNLALVEQRLGHTDAAETHYREAISEFQAASNVNGELLAAHNVALLLLARGELAEAEARIDASADALKEASNGRIAAHITGLRARLAGRRGDSSLAETLYRQTMETLTTSGTRQDIAVAQAELSIILARAGRIEEARALAVDCLRVGLEIGSDILLIHGFEAFCAITLGTDDAEDAARYLAMARALRLANGYAFEGADDLTSWEAELRTRLDERVDHITAAIGYAEVRKTAADLASLEDRESNVNERP